MGRALRDWLSSFLTAFGTGLWSGRRLTGARLSLFVPKGPILWRLGIPELAQSLHVMRAGGGKIQMNIGLEGKCKCAASPGNSGALQAGERESPASWSSEPRELSGKPRLVQGTWGDLG